MEQVAHQLVIGAYRGPQDVKLYPNTHRVLRAGCGHPGWLSPEGAAWLDRLSECQTICTDCQTLDDDQPIYMVPGAMDAAQAYFGPEGTRRIEQVIEELGVKEL